MAVQQQDGARQPSHRNRRFTYPHSHNTAQRLGPRVFTDDWNRVSKVGVRMWPIYLALLLALLCVGWLISFDRFYDDRILPQVRVRGQLLSDMTRGEAGAALRARYGTWLRRPVTLSLGETRLTPSLEELGVALDMDRTLGEAYTVGRSANPLIGLTQLYNTLRYGVDLPLYVTVDEAQMRRYLMTIAERTDIRPRDARLELNGTEVRTVVGANGRQLLVDQSVANITRALQTLEPSDVPLISRVLMPSVDNTIVLPVAERVGTLLSAPMSLEAAGTTWVWQPEDLAKLLQLSQQGRVITATLDIDEIRRRVEEMAVAIESRPIEPRLRFSDGTLQIEREGRDGFRLDVEQGVAALEQALWRPTRSLALPVAVTRPAVTPENLGDLGITELVAEGVSSFSGSPEYRITNIAVGARLMDGVLIAPGEQFAFNTLVEPVDERNGFVPGLAIVNNRTQQEWGGGLCQVSTTVFRAAFWAGVPIDERHEHRFRIFWYEKFEPIGMDAAIFTGANDLRFTNDTGHWLLMHTYLDPYNATLTVHLYGTRPDRQVLQGKPVINKRIPAPTKPVYIDDPRLPAGVVRQTDIAQEGLEVSLLRTVMSGGQVLRQERFVSMFEPWPNIYVRGTAR